MLHHSNALRTHGYVEQRFQLRSFISEKWTKHARRGLAKCGNISLKTQRIRPKCYAGKYGFIILLLRVFNQCMTFIKYLTQSPYSVHILFSLILTTVFFFSVIWRTPTLNVSEIHVWSTPVPPPHTHIFDYYLGYLVQKPGNFDRTKDGGPLNVHFSCWLSSALQGWYRLSKISPSCLGYPRPPWSKFRLWKFRP